MKAKGELIYPTGCNKHILDSIHHSYTHVQTSNISKLVNGKTKKKAIKFCGLITTS